MMGNEETFVPGYIWVGHNSSFKFEKGKARKDHYDHLV